MSLIKKLVSDTVVKPAVGAPHFDTTPSSNTDRHERPFADDSPRSQLAARILFVNRSYWPDMEATGQLLTELCESLATDDRYEISILCGQPNFPAEGAEFKNRGSQVHKNVVVRRTIHTLFDKSKFIGRAVNFISFCISAFFSLLLGPRPDVIVCQTDPPLSPIAACLVACIRRTKFVCYLQDVYPDIAVECGKVREGFFMKLLRKLLVWCYSRADKIIVVSNDMRDWLRDHRVDSSKVEVIHNWVDVEAIYPIKENNSFRAEHFFGPEKFVVMYSGNIGQTQRFDVLLEAADRLKDHEGIEFVFVGQGVKVESLKANVASLGLDNIRIMPYQPKDRLAESLSAADIQVVLLDERMTRLMMPSKLYSALASGTPVLGLGDPGSHLAEIIVDNGCGWFFSESQSDEIALEIQQAAMAPELIRPIGKAARELAVTRFNRADAINNFLQVISSTIGRALPAANIEAEIEQSVSQELVYAEEPSGNAELATNHEPALSQIKSP